MYIVTKKKGEKVMTKRFGFTLAEVLITLGIIGVVAAMTMPTLMNATNGAQYKTAYKKALSVISQAIVLNLALDDYDLGTTTSTGTAADDFSMFNLLKNRTNVVRTETGSIAGYAAILGSNANSQGSADDGVLANNYTMFFNDGIMFTFPNTAQNCTEARDSEGIGKGVAGGACRGFIDVNGTKAPNRQTVCSSGDGDDCIVDSPADIYPVVFYDQGVYPASDAARAVLYKK